MNCNYNKNDNVVISALGLHDGMVLCIAKKGGRYSNGEESIWFVPKNRYDKRDDDYIIHKNDIQAPGDVDKCWSAFYTHNKRTMKDIVQFVTNTI